MFSQFPESGKAADHMSGLNNEHVYIGAVDRERDANNMNNNYDVIGLLTAGHSDWVVWVGEREGGRECISHMHDLKESSGSREPDSWSVFI